VTEFLGELYVSRHHAAAVEQSELRVRDAADQLRSEGRPVRFVRTIFIPEDETCFYLFEARSASTVHEVGTRASLHFERVSRSWRRGDDGFEATTQPREGTRCGKSQPSSRSL
jgi:hypothetical protein